jgi:hypothetical protein
VESVQLCAAVLALEDLLLLSVGVGTAAVYRADNAAQYAAQMKAKQSLVLALEDLLLLSFGVGTAAI